MVRDQSSKRSGSTTLIFPWRSISASASSATCLISAPRTEALALLLVIRGEENEGEGECRGPWAAAEEEEEDEEEEEEEEEEKEEEDEDDCGAAAPLAQQPESFVFSTRALSVSMMSDELIPVKSRICRTLMFCLYRGGCTTASKMA